MLMVNKNGSQQIFMRNNYLHISELKCLKVNVSSWKMQLSLTVCKPFFAQIQHHLVRLKEDLLDLICCRLITLPFHCSM